MCTWRRKYILELKICTWRWKYVLLVKIYLKVKICTFEKMPRDIKVELKICKSKNIWMPKWYSLWLWLGPLFPKAGPYSSKSAQLKGVLSGSTNSRKWNIKVFQHLVFKLWNCYSFQSKVIQVLCSSKASPWNGCLQYFTGISGTVSLIHKTCKIIIYVQDNISILYISRGLASLWTSV